MSEHEASLYDDMEAEMFLPLRTGEITAANAAALSAKLLQMANGAVYLMTAMRFRSTIKS